MKYLFFLVLFANIVFFLWEITNGDRKFDPPSRYGQNPSSQQILLVNEVRLNSPSDLRVAGQPVEEPSETQEAQQPADTAENDNRTLVVEQAVENTTEFKTFCYEIGPFADNKIQQKWLDDVRAKSDSTDIVKKPIDIHHGFVVFIPAHETFEKSKAYYEMLKRQGVTDLWLFKKGSSRGMISLGIYRKKQSGEKIQRQYSAQGIDARIKPYVKTEQRYVVRIRSQQEISQYLELLGAWKKVLPVLEINEVSHCDETDGDSLSLPRVAEANAV